MIYPGPSLARLGKDWDKYLECVEGQANVKDTGVPEKSVCTALGIQHTYTKIKKTTKVMMLMSLGIYENVVWGLKSRPQDPSILLLPDKDRGATFYVCL